METALGLPTAFGALDLDQQLDGFRAAMQRRLGVSEVADLATPATQERLVQLFLMRADIDANAAATTGGRIALTLLQGAVRAG